MNYFFSKTKEFIFAKQTSILASTLILSGMMILSRIAGFIRYRILAGYFTASELDIFFAAFRIPDLVFEILINGALSTTFIPFFVEYQKRGDAQHRVISSVINIVTLCLFAGIIVLVAFMPLIMPLMAPGFTPEQMKQLVYYSRILLLGQLPFLVIGNFLSGIAQAKKSFLIPALAPVIYNLAIIVGVLALESRYHLMAPIIGVVIGSLLFLIVQIPVMHIAQFQYLLVVSHVKESIRFFRVATPRVLTIIVGQIDATVDLALATLLGSGAYTMFYLAQRLQLLPVSVIGMAIGQASLPYLTEVFQEKKMKEFRSIVVSSVLNIFFFTIPAAIFLMVTRTPIVRLFFGGEKFDWSATVLTAYTLSAFALSLPLHSAYYFLTRCFYAVFDTKTPFYITAVTILLGALLSVWFVLGLGLPVWSLALSFSITMSLRTFALIVLLRKKLDGLDLRHLAGETIRITLAGFNSGVMTYFLIRLLDGLILDTTRTINIFFLLLIATIFYGSAYLFLSYIFGVAEMGLISKMLLKVSRYRRKITEVYQGVE